MDCIRIFVLCMAEAFRNMIFPITCPIAIGRLKDIVSKSIVPAILFIEFQKCICTNTIEVVLRCSFGVFHFVPIKTNRRLGNPG